MSVRHRNHNITADPAATVPQQVPVRPVATSPPGRAVVVNAVTQSMRRSDEDMRAKVSEELLDASGVDTHVRVAVTGGVVTLSGEVGSVAERTAVRRAAMRVAGVKALAVEVQVCAPGTCGAHDIDV